MAAIGDIYELKHVQRDGDNVHIENVYFYRQIADPAGGLWSTQSQRLAEDWMTDVYTVMRPSIPGTYITDELRVRNLFNEADSYVMPLNSAGTRSFAATELLPRFLSGVITLATDNGLVKKGRKMIAGLAEADQNNGLFTAAGYTLFAVRAAAMLLGVSTLFGGAKAFEPVVVKRIRTGTAGNYVYRLPENQLEAVAGIVQSAILSSIVSAQDTRKS